MSSNAICYKNGVKSEPRYLGATPPDEATPPPPPEEATPSPFPPREATPPWYF